MPVGLLEHGRMGSLLSRRGARERASNPKKCKGRNSPAEVGRAEMPHTLPSWPDRFGGCSPARCHGPLCRDVVRDLSPSRPGAGTRALEGSRL